MMSRQWGYYAEEEIREKALSEGGARLCRDAIRFYRLCLMSHDKQIYVSPKAPAEILLAAKLAAGKHPVVRKKGELARCSIIYAAYRIDDISVVANALCEKASIAMLAGFPESEVKSLAEIPKVALLLLGKRNSLLFKREDMQQVSYTVTY